MSKHTNQMRFFIEMAAQETTCFVLVEEAPPPSFLFLHHSTTSSWAGFSPYGGKTSKPTRLAAVTGASFR